MATMFPHVQRAKTRQHPFATGETFLRGALVQLDGSEDVIEPTGLDPTPILGFSLHAAGVEPDEENVIVALAEDDAQFWMAGSSDPVKADINQSFGVLKNADDVWIVDKADTTNTRVYVVDVDIERKLFLVKVLEAHRQVAA